MEVPQVFDLPEPKLELMELHYWTLSTQRRKVRND
jgi:hypothetical protein